MIEYSACNHKIKRKARIMIFNMQPYHNCVSRRLGLCQLDKPSDCYARKAEILRPNVLPYRLRQMEYWNTSTIDAIAKDIIEVQRGKRIKFLYLRLNESGDFRHADDIDKASAIADIIIAEAGMATYTYTARKDLFPHRHSRYLVINGSGFMIDNNFMCVDRHYKANEAHDIMCVGDCSICDRCKHKGGLIIKERKH